MDQLQLLHDMRKIRATLATIVGSDKNLIENIKRFYLSTTTIFMDEHENYEFQNSLTPFMHFMHHDDIQRVKYTSKHKEVLTVPVNKVMEFSRYQPSLDDDTPETKRLHEAKHMSIQLTSHQENNGGAGTYRGGNEKLGYAVEDDELGSEKDGNREKDSLEEVIK